MALNRSKNYGTRWETSSEESPQGKFKDKSSETAVDGSYLQKSWINDISDGWNGAILKGYVPTQEQLDAVNPLGFNNNAGIIGTPVNEIIDTANDSQVYNAWYKHTQEISQDVVDTTISTKQLEEKIAALEAQATELETLADGCWFNYWNGATGSHSRTTPTTYTGLDFSAQTQADDPIYLGNNITIDSNDGSILNIAKAGTYQFNFTFFRNPDNFGQGNLRISMNKPSNDQNVNGGFISCFGAGKSLNLSNYQALDTFGLNSYIRRDDSIDIDLTNTTSYTEQHAILHYGVILPMVYIVSDEDNFQLKFEMKTTNTIGFNFTTALNRVGGSTLSSPYMSPTDVVIDD